MARARKAWYAIVRSNDKRRRGKTDEVYAAGTQVELAWAVAHHVKQFWIAYDDCNDNEVYDLIRALGSPRHWGDAPRDLPAEGSFDPYLVADVVNQNSSHWRVRVLTHAEALLLGAYLVEHSAPPRQR